MKRLLVLGARSDIARATAAHYASQGWQLLLTGRDKAELERDAADLALRYQVEVSAHELDALAFESHGACIEALPDFQGVLCAVGYLGDQDQAEREPAEAQLILDTNYNGCVSLLSHAAARLRAAQSGFIIGIGSVAGDRGRQSNYTYGSAKAALHAWLAGLRNRLYPHGVHVLTVKPGFVATRMTHGMPLPKLLTAQPEQVARDIYRAQQRGLNTLYTRWFWRYIMWVIRLVPEPIFKRLKL